MRPVEAASGWQRWRRDVMPKVKPLRLPELTRAEVRRKLQELADHAYYSDMAMAFVDVMSRGGRHVRVSITSPRKKKAS